MTTHTCARCDGRGIICATCKKPHEPRGSYFRTRCRGRKRIPCPGSVVKPKDGEVVHVDAPPKVIPHFETRTECDVCRVQKRGSFHESTGRGHDSHGWALIDSPGKNTSLYLCPACSKHHEEIRTMTLEYLMNDRGGLCGGQWIDRQGRLLPVESAPETSTPRPQTETPGCRADGSHEWYLTPAGTLCRSCGLRGTLPALPGA